ncbi:N-acetylmuramoyl-L-alanine amidase [bacterium SCSIO 12741]|nr:N-acetylmuramoyl-L-alanine amidase [bacterium SCSIO 12741]
MKTKPFIILASSMLFVLLTSFYPYRPGEYGLKKVVIDAGHGGKDPGSIGVDGIKEKDIVLDIALRVGRAIKANHPDVKLVFTRETDVFIELTNRANIANKHNADLFISIHADAAVNKSAYGTETFALGLHKEAANLDIVKRENKVILMEDNYESNYEGFDPKSMEFNIFSGLVSQANLDQSLRFASKVQEQFKSAGRRDRGVKQAGFVVLYKTTMPSVLVETGFITNTKEGRFLNQEDNRVLISNCIYNAFKAYKKDVDSQFADLAPGTSTPPPSKPDHGVRFRVQIVSSPEPVEIKATNFKGLDDIRELKVNGSYKYTVGNELTFEEGLNLQKHVRENGYKDAFLIGVYQGKRITITEARKIVEQH